MSPLRSRLARTTTRALGAVAVVAVGITVLPGLSSGTLARPQQRGASPAVETTTATVASLVPTTGAYFGAAVPGGWGDNQYDAVENYEAAAGRKLDLQRIYQSWGEPLNGGLIRWDVNTNRTPMISIYPVRGSTVVRWADIAAGRYDADIARQADEIRSLNAPVWLTLNHEPEDDPRHGTPAEFVAAWRHWVDVFRGRGVNNAAFTWIMMAWSFASNEALTYYPGDAYVDWVASDGYNWGICRGGGWCDFRSVFSDMYAFGLAHAKPMLIAEYASAEDPTDPNHKSEWLAEAAAQLRTMPQIKAISYWGGGDCFKVNSTPVSQAGFANMGADDWFHVRPTADLRVDTTTGAAPLAVTLDGGRSTDPHGPIANWSLDFGDGTPPATGIGTPVPVPHVYSGSGTAPARYTATLTVTDADGIRNWATATITASPRPNVTTGAPSNITGTSAVVAARVDGNLLPTTYAVEYGLTTSYGSRTGATPLSTGDRATSVTVPVTGLQQATGYHYRIVATNAAGTSYGDDRTFTTYGVPAVTDARVASYAPRTVTIRSAVDPNGLATTYRVQYGPTTSYGSLTPAVNAGSGNRLQNVSVDVPGLAPETTYHYRIMATNGLGTTYGPDNTFTSAGAPAVRTDSATRVTRSSAVLNGWVDDNSLPTTYHFQWGPTTSYGRVTPVRSFGAKADGAPVPGQSLTGLTSGTTYHFRIVATNAAGTTYGANQFFRTP